MLQQKEKYLYFDHNIYAGLDDQIYVLEVMMMVALSLKRILIVKNIETAAQHRTSRKYVPFDWDRYFDLAQTKISEIRSDRSIKEIKSPFCWVHEKNFNFKNYAQEQIRYIDGTQLYDSGNEHYPLLYVSKTQIPILEKDEVMIKSRGLTISHYCGLIYKPVYHVSLSPSSKVNELSDIVLNRFGTDRQSSDYIQKVINSKTRLKDHDFQINYYVCMHLRTQAMALLYKDHYYAMQKEQIEYIVKTVSDMHRDIPIYIMSDMELSYFDFLRPKYKIYTYQDFPILKKLFDSKKKPVDHNLLYCVEKNIMRYALVKIFPPGRNRLRLDTNASYEVPPHVSESFYASHKKRTRKFRILSYKEALDKRIIQLKNRFRR